MDEGTPHEGIARRDALHTGVLRYVVSTLGTAGVLYGSLLALHVSAYVIVSRSKGRVFQIT